MLVCHAHKNMSSQYGLEFQWHEQLRNSNFKNKLAPNKPIGNSFVSTHLSPTFQQKSSTGRTWLVYVSWNTIAKFAPNRAISLAMYRPKNLRSNCRVSHHCRLVNWRQRKVRAKRWQDRRAMLDEFCPRSRSTAANIRECDVHIGQVSRRMAAIDCMSHAKAMSYRIIRILHAPLHLQRKSNWNCGTVKSQINRNSLGK